MFYKEVLSDESLFGTVSFRYLLSLHFTFLSFLRISRIYLIQQWTARYHLQPDIFCSLMSPATHYLLQFDVSCNPMSPAAQFFLQSDDSCSPMSPAVRCFLQPNVSCSPMSPVAQCLLQSDVSCSPMSPAAQYSAVFQDFR